MIHETSFACLGLICNALYMHMHTYNTIILYITTFFFFAETQKSVREAMYVSIIFYCTSTKYDYDTSNYRVHM